MIWHHISLYGIWQELGVYGLVPHFLIWQWQELVVHLVPLQDTVDVASLFELGLYHSSI